MSKQKIYIDTSIISHLRHEDAPEKMQETIAFWEEIKAGKYEIVISPFTLLELQRCPEPKQTELLELLESIRYTLLPETDEVRSLVKAYLEEGVLTPRNEGDLLHIAFAVMSGCDAIASWNFKHMVRMTTIQRVRAVNAQRGYSKLLDIVSPTMLIGGE